MIVRVGPVGTISTGSVLDVARKPFEQALKDYDSRLYVKWNPKKLYGHGCWEIRRRPDEKSIVDAVKLGNITISRLEYVEIDLVNHVLDCAFLNYDQLRKIQSMDTTKNNQKYFVDQLEAREQAAVKDKQERARADMRYAAKQFKTEIRDFKEYLASGHSPDLAISQHWGN